MTTVVRPDLSARTAISKSALNGFDACQTAAWFDLHQRRPLIPQERITFGSAVDAGVEVIAKFLRAGQTVVMEQAMLAAAEVVDRDEVAVDLDEVEHALTRYMVECAGQHDWSLVRTQEHIAGVLPDLGEVDGHPDLWFPHDAIWDIKTGAREKKDEPTVELGWYALLAAEVVGEPVPTVGYETWARTARPHWQRLSFEVTDELLRWTVERAAAYVRAKRADAVLNRNAEVPVNWAMTGGPKYGPSSCATCQYADLCSIAYRGVSDDAA
ncbi:MAG TPA: PD-(D/E)XK nuclease family protein [Propionibacteriaceae bacterium]|nr:PD-(D/E)XK nuclease family protein [Propionibacteriaceae bacterium]